MIADSHNYYDFTDWYVFLGFSWTAAIGLAIYIKYISSLDEEDEQDQWEK